MLFPEVFVLLVHNEEYTVLAANTMPEMMPGNTLRMLVATI